MAQFTDWIARLFSTGPTAGLSGELEDVLPLEDDDTFFHPRLRRHCTDEDFVVDPSLLWSARSPSGRRVGLRTHLQDVRGEGPAGFTDILVVVNERDHRRTFDRVAERWADEASRVLAPEFRRFCDEEGFEVLYASRPVRFGFVCDGSPEMNGRRLGLAEGEFATGLLPNFYTGPINTSRRIIAVHLNIPGAWDGYREVGFLHSDQVMFTIGSHWLDGFSHPALQVPALYRLQQYLDGTFVHIVNPDAQDRFQVTSDEETGGPAVLTIQSRDGEPVAHLVLAVLETTYVEPEPIKLPEEDQIVAIPAGRRKARTIPFAEAAAPPPTPPPATKKVKLPGTKTIVPETIRERILTLRERGALLQRVHFSRFMRGYDVYVTSSCQVTTSGRDRAATFRVRDNKVHLVVHEPDVRVDGRVPDMERPLDLGPRATIEVGGAQLEYADLTDTKADGWPYLAELRRPASSIHMVFGGRYRVGRDRRCKVRLPDEPHNDNIAWLESAVSGGTIRTRSGEIPKSRFYTDSIMVASEHAEIDLAEAPTLRSIARHCSTYIRRGGELLTLFPTQGRTKGTTELQLHPGDELMVGNCLFHVSYPPEQVAMQKELTASMLAGAADTQPEARPAPPPFEPEGPVDAPAAAGLGEAASKPPAPPRFDVPGYDSILDTPINLMITDETGNLDDDGSAGAVDEPPPVPKQHQAPAARGLGAADLPPAVGLGEDAGGTAPESPRFAVRGFDSILGFDPIEPAALREAEAKAKAKAPAPTPVAPPPAAADLPRPAKRVLVIDEATWQLECARPARLVLVGWMVAGRVTLGNHSLAHIGVPHTRSSASQIFEPTDYLALKVRGRRVSGTVLVPDDVRLVKDGEEVTEAQDLKGVTIEIVRRDSDGEEDFSVLLQLQDDRTLPDPRSRLLAIDAEDRLTEALFTVGLPLHDVRDLELGPISLRASFDGQEIVLRDYLASYKTPEGYKPFFVTTKGTFRTAPEDGRLITLQAGDRLIAGNAVYELRTA